MFTEVRRCDAGSQPDTTITPRRARRPRLNRTKFYTVVYTLIAVLPATAAHQHRALFQTAVYAGLAFIFAAVAGGCVMTSREKRTKASTTVHTSPAPSGRSHERVRGTNSAPGDES
jgi:hypothetical protein